MNMQLIPNTLQIISTGLPLFETRNREINPEIAKSLSDQFLSQIHPVFISNINTTAAMMPTSQ
jgi:hypothetical protein